MSSSAPGAPTTSGNSRDGNFKIQVKSSKGSPTGSLQIDEATTIDISKFKTKLKATVQDTVASGGLRISGRLPDSGKFKASADIEGAWSASDDGTLWGFNLTNVDCSGISNIDCGTDGVVYLNLSDPIGPATGERKITTSGDALTSVAVVSEVPIPAAGWLFCCGLLGLAAVSTRWSARQ
jgi:hypothetical protein